MFAEVHILDIICFVLFFLAVAGYRLFLAAMLKSSANALYLGKLQSYRNAWVEEHSGGRNSLLVVQTLRNNIMAASFLASTSILLIMGAVNLLGNLEALGEMMLVVQFIDIVNPTINLLKILLIIITLSYSFFNFMSYIREVNYMSFVLNIPKQQLDTIEGEDSAKLISQSFLASGIHFSMGMRGYYFLIPLIMWIFNPVLMILAIILILIILMRRDLGR